MNNCICCTFNFKFSLMVKRKQPCFIIFSINMGSVYSFMSNPILWGISTENPVIVGLNDWECGSLVDAHIFEWCFGEGVLRSSPQYLQLKQFIFKPLLQQTFVLSHIDKLASRRHRESVLRLNRLSLRYHLSRYLLDLRWLLYDLLLLVPQKVILMWVLLLFFDWIL